ncbi:lytic murein transglycosylase, partial [Enterococcus sp. HPCN18]
MWGDITRRVRRLGIFSALALLVGSTPALAQDEAGFQSYLQQVRGTASAQGVSR